jgi:hypothetical protein
VTSSTATSDDEDEYERRVGGIGKDGRDEDVELKNDESRRTGGVGWEEGWVGIRMRPRSSHRRRRVRVMSGVSSAGQPEC